MNCKNCKKQGCSLAGKDHEMSFECKAYVGKTNADRIRAMSDEELAEWLCDIAGWLPAYEGKMHPILDWLRQEGE